MSLGAPLKDARARVAIDLGAESCRVSLLRWVGGEPRITLVHRMANGPVNDGGSLRWPLTRILAGLEEGLRKAADEATEGIASIAVDGWAVDYARLGATGVPLAEPLCYRDERTVAAQAEADKLAPPEWIYTRTGAHPSRVNTVYQLLADRAAGAGEAPWVNLPEYILMWLGGRRVAERTNATHSGLVDARTREWCGEVLERLRIDAATLPPLVDAGEVVGKVSGPLAELAAFRDTALIAPGTHDTASAIASIAEPLDEAAYLCSGTWSLVGSLLDAPIATLEALAAGFTNLGAVGGKTCFHSNVNGMWMLKQCMEGWAAQGRAWRIEALIDAAETVAIPGAVDVGAAPLLLAGEMPARLNEQLQLAGHAEITDTAGNEPKFARLIFESLAAQYARTLSGIEKLTGRKLRRIHILGGGSQNRLLTRLTAERTGLDVVRGQVEGSTIGNLAVQCAAGEGAVTAECVREWAKRLAGAQSQH